MDKSTYFLRFPFKPLHWITGIETPIEFNVNQLSFSLSSQKPYLILTIKPFKTEEEAHEFMPKLWGAFACLSVKHNTGFLIDMTLDKVAYASDPIQAAENLSKSFGKQINDPVHGLASGNIPVILPIDKNFKYLTLGDATITLTFAQEVIVASLEQALKNDNLLVIYTNEKLKTALELLSDSQREVSQRSKFLTYIMALEVLSEKVTKDKIALNLLNTFDKVIEQEKKQTLPDTDEFHSLESLQRELVFRKEASLRSRIRKLVLDNLKNLSLEDRIIRARQVVWAYDIRSNLVHDGRISNSDLSKASEIAIHALRDILAVQIGFSF